MLDTGPKDEFMAILCRRPVNIQVYKVGRWRFEEVSQRLDRNAIESGKTDIRRSEW